MKRPWMMPIGLLTAGLVAMGCGSSTSASPTTTRSPGRYSGTSLSWMKSNGVHWNAILNADQSGVDSASVTGSETNVAAFFTQLASACERLQRDARQASQVQAAPSASLANAWHEMTVRTEQYASKCLGVTDHPHSNQALVQWNDSLKAMNTANAVLNTQVKAIRGSPTTTTAAG